MFYTFRINPSEKRKYVSLQINRKSVHLKPGAASDTTTSLKKLRHALGYSKLQPDSHEEPIRLTGKGESPATFVDFIIPTTFHVVECNFYPAEHSKRTFYLILVYSYSE